MRKWNYKMNYGKRYSRLIGQVLMAAGLTFLSPLYSAQEACGAGMEGG